jgi:hypothetical protein
LGSFSFEVFPNPNNGSGFNLTFNSVISEPVLISIHDVNGKLVVSKSITYNGKNANYFMNLDGILQSGMYFLSASSNGEISHKSLIVH